MMDIEYRSSVLRCNVEDDGCAVCKFIGGDRGADTMLEVIRILDSRLEREEEYSRGLCRVIAMYRAEHPT